MTTREWARRVDEFRANDTWIERGNWHGDMDVLSSTPMRGPFFVVRWNRPTVTVCHEDPQSALALAIIVERAIAGQFEQRG